MLALLWALAFAPQIFAGRAFLLGDTANLRAFADFSRQRWEERRERTHWNPYLFAGVPATASLQDSRPQWLPDRLLDAFDGLHRRPGLPPLAIPLAVGFAGAVAAAALARELWGARTATMTAAGAAWGLQPNVVVPFAFGHDAQFMASAMLPALLLGVARAQAPGGVGAMLGLALAVAVAVLAAHPQVAMSGLALAAAFALQRAARARSAAAIAAPAAGAAFGLALSAVAWWPALRYTAHTVRGVAAGGIGWSEVATWSAGAGDLASLAWPWAAGFGGATYFGGLARNDFPQYAGIVACGLAAAGLARRRDGGNATAALLAAAGVVAAVLSLGARLGPVYLALHEHVPLLATFRIAVNWLLVTQFAIVLLAARGAERLLENAAARRVAGRAAVVALGAGLAFALVAGAGPGGGPYGEALRRERPRAEAAVVERAARAPSLDLVVRSLLLALALGALAARVRIGAALLPVAMVADLATVDAPFLRRAGGDLARLRRPPPAIAVAVAADPLHRAVVPRPDLFFANDWIPWRARSLSGFHPAVPRAWDELRRLGLLGHVPVLRALAVGYVAGGGFDASDTARFERLATAGAPGAEPREAWRLRGALPRAYAAAEVVGLSREVEVLGVLAMPAFDPVRRTAKTGTAGAGRYFGSPECRIDWVVDEPDRIELSVRAPAPAFVVVADTWLPGWTAEVNGAPAPVHRVNHMMRGVAVPGGGTRLVMRYVPEGWNAATAVSRAAFAVWITAALATAAARRRRGAGARGAR